MQRQPLLPFFPTTIHNCLSSTFFPTSFLAYISLPWNPDPSLSPPKPPLSMAGRAAPRPHTLAPTSVSYLFLLLAATRILSWPTVASAGAEEGEALLRFKATLFGLKADLPSWIPGPAPCNANYSTWDGVICFNGHVWGLQLEDMGLIGQLDLRPLTALNGLRAISFMHNNLDGPLPDLSLLGALKAVYLSGNKFSGEIQGDAFAGLRSLKKLFLSSNGFVGPIPDSLAGLEKLLELRLDHNRFSGRIPEFRQHSLLKADFSFNALEGPVPQIFSQMKPVYFRGNPMLCGAPLAAACNPQRQPNRHGLSGWKLALIINLVIFIIFLFALSLFLVYFRRRQLEKKVAVGCPSSKKSTEDHAVIIDSKVRPAVAVPHRRHQQHGIHGRLVFLQEGRERFELHDLLRASAEVLGSGDFGSSFKVVLAAGPTVVVKRFKEMNGVGWEDFEEHMRRLGRLSHPNLLPLVTYYYKKEEKLLVTDFVPNGSLAHMLHGKHGSTVPPLDWPTRLKIVKGVVRGLGYLYDQLPVLTLPHGHLKSSNVLLNDNLEPLLTDYALVPVMNANHASQVMVAYKSPEVAKLGRPSKKSDVWSLGILILEILTGNFPANFLHKGSGSGAGLDLAACVSALLQDERISEEVFDDDMKEDENSLIDMRELLNLGIDCCKEDVGERPEMWQVIERIEQLKTKEGVCS